MSFDTEAWKRMRIFGSRRKFERLVLRVVYTTRNAYGVPIQAKVEELWGKPVRFASVYSALDRLEERGYVESWEGNPTVERAYYPKRYYAITAEGEIALREWVATDRHP